MILLTGITLLASSYSARQRREADYAMALQLAEAGINYELRWMSGRLTETYPAHRLVEHPTGFVPSGQNSIPGVEGKFNVYVCNTDGNPNWTLPNDMMIVSTGTVGKMSRTVSVIAKSSGGTGGQSIFSPQYAVFAYKRLLFRNSSSAIIGNMGVNGPALTSGYSCDVESNGVGNASASGKPLTLAGGANLVPGNKINPNYTNNPGSINVLAQNVTWPTVDAVVTGTFPAGWSTLSSAANVAAQWGRIRMYRTQSRVMTLAGTKPLNTVSTSSTILNNACVKTYAEDGQPTNCMILTPGDYYFTRVQLDSSGFSGPAPIIYIDCNAVTTGGTPGPVRIWIGGADGTNDYFKSEIRYTTNVASEKAQLSRIFYGKPNTLSFNGNGVYSGVYAIRNGPGTGTGSTISLDQSAKFFGTIIADFVTLQGGVDITYVNGIASATDYSTGGAVGRYAYLGNWQEKPWRDPANANTIKGGSVFSDGTSR
ncbi:hypothetical protein EON81_10255 [bacterium]|nr:MAG: hypothetical protein EON81_10255 [bacterium]